MVAAFKDTNPQAPVHVLIIPKKHVKSLLELDGSDKELTAPYFLRGDTENCRRARCGRVWFSARGQYGQGRAANG